MAAIVGPYHAGCAPLTEIAAANANLEHDGCGPEQELARGAARVADASGTDIADGEKSATRKLLKRFQAEIDQLSEAKKQAPPERANDLAKQLRVARTKLAAVVETAGPAIRRITSDDRDRQRRKLAEIADALEKQRETQPLQDNSPTRERLRTLAGIEAIAPPIADKNTRAATRSYLTQSVVDFYAARPARPGQPGTAKPSAWGLDEEQGLRHLVQVYNRAGGGEPRVTASYGAGVHTAYGPRDGGVRRGKTEAHVDAHNKLVEVEALLHAALGSKCVMVVRWFVGETERVAEGATMIGQMQHAGRMLAPLVKDEDRAWGIAFGWLQAAGRFAYGKWVVSERAAQRTPSTPQQVEARRNQRMKRLGL